MSNLYFCENQARRLTLLRQAAINGVDFLEVIDDASGLPRQQILFLHTFQPLAAGQLTIGNLMLTGGATTKVAAVWAFTATQILNAPDVNGLPGLSAAELPLLKSLIAAKLPPPSPPPSPPTASTDAVLVVRTDRTGDFAPYRITLVASPKDPTQPAGFDVQLRFIAFAFKAACPTDIDCLSPPCAGVAAPAAPELDYLTKDYAGFRQLMLDRLAVVAPELTAQNAADLPVVLIELLAHAADKMSYFQDAVATEAYLGTARRRRSVRRHARLLDYAIGEGSSARLFVRFRIDPAVATPVTIPAGTQLMTRDVQGPVRLSAAAARVAFTTGTPVFETMHDVKMASRNLNQIPFYTWGDEHCCLPAGATRATLDNTGNVLGPLLVPDGLAPGALLAFVEQLGPDSGLPEDADPHHRHVVRLTRVTPNLDTLLFEAGSPPTQPQRVVEIEWSREDALPFPLCLWRVPAAAPQPVSVAWGNIALADHGLTVADVPTNSVAAPPLTVTVNARLQVTPGLGPFEPVLAMGPLMWQGQVKDAAGRAVPFDRTASAASAFGWQAGDVVPAISLSDSQSAPWQPRRDLLESDPLSQDFVVETEDDGSVELRFGDGTLGREPTSSFTAIYRIGNVLDGNIGADTLSHLVSPAVGPALPVLDLTNPLPARGATAPETIDHVRINAPQAFRVQKRAVTEADYAAAAQRHPDVQRAHAVRVFTGAWFTIFIAIDRFGGRPVDDAFRAEIDDLLEPYRMTGHDFVIQAARSVPLEISLPICVAPGFLPGDVRLRLSQAFSASTLANGQPGFFNPDNFTFGQPLYLSQVLSVASAVLGVASINTSTTGRPALIFRRTDQPVSRTGDPARDDVIRVGPGEVIRVDNDINQPQNGKITFVLQGAA